MTFNPHTEADRQVMEKAIGITDVSELFEVVPSSVRFPELDLLPTLTEMEAARHLTDLSRQNLAIDASKSFLGAGAYRHYIPATVGQILARGEFYTAYTPYQPEVAQGTLQTIYEFQTMVAELYGTEVANASLYDGATAMAESVHMALGLSKNRSKVVIAGTVNPRYLEVTRTYLSGISVEIVELASADPYVVTSDEITAAIDNAVAAVVIQYPNYFGALEDIGSIAEAAHSVGALLLTSSYPTAFSILKPPGEHGADIVTGEGQPLGVPVGFGGPFVGLLGARKSQVRQMPGRLVAEATDSEGKRGFVLALQTREQHIRREKATSNICTNQGLMATAATVYMASVGPQGFREIGQRCYDNAHYLAAKLEQLDGVSLPLNAPFFNEFVVDLPVSAAMANDALLKAGMLGGLDLGGNTMLLAVTELHDKAALDDFVGVIRSL